MGLAAVGNVLTHRDYRGRGFAKIVTGAVTQELLRFCDQVVLNVRSDNPPALRGVPGHRVLASTSASRSGSSIVGGASGIASSLPSDAGSPTHGGSAQPGGVSDGLDRSRAHPDAPRPPVTPPTARPLRSPHTTSRTSDSRTKASAASSGQSGRCPSCASSASASRASSRSAGVRIAAALHVTTETANLVRTLKAGGAPGRPVRLQPAVDQGRRRRGARGALRHQHLRPPGRGPRHLLRASQRGRGHPTRT